MNKHEFWTFVNDCIDLVADEYGCSYCPAKAYYDELNVACPATNEDYCSGICRDVYEKIEEQERKEKCKWIAYDHRTMCPKYHDIDNPYWRIPETRKDVLKYCPYCGKEIDYEG